MAVDQSIYLPLFTELSVKLDGTFFHVFPGEIAMIQAFGFMSQKSRADKSEQAVQQVACLEMLMFKEGFIERPNDTRCRIYDLDQYRTELLAREVVRINGCPVRISKSNNLLLLNIPGSYCFHMDDPTALGQVRIYLRKFSKDEFPWNSKFFIGEKI